MLRLDIPGWSKCLTRNWNVARWSSKIRCRKRKPRVRSSTSLSTSNITGVFVIILSCVFNCLLVFQVTLLSSRTCLWFLEDWDLSNNCRNAYKALTMTSDSSTTRKYLMLCFVFLLRRLDWELHNSLFSSLNIFFVCVMIGVWSLWMERRWSRNTMSWCSNSNGQFILYTQGKPKGYMYTGG